MHPTTIVAALLAIVSSTLAANSTVVNNCHFPVYLWAVGDSSSKMITIKRGHNWTEPYQARAEGGMAIKVATKPDVSSPITQFEYTLADVLWYDLSNVNGAPFAGKDMQLAPSIPSDNPSACKTVTCPSDSETCTEAYTLADDNWSTNNCNSEADTVLTLCGAPAAAQKKRDISRGSHDKYHRRSRIMRA